MESFSSKIKKEICSFKIENKEDAYSQALGMALFAGEFDENNEFVISYENPETAKRFENLILTAKPDLKFEKYTVKKKKKTLNFVKIPSSEENIINFKSLKKQKNLAFFISGAFLSCGSITNPEIDYHLEFHLSSIDLCSILINAIECLKKTKLNPKIVKRRNKYSIYIKESEKIEDFLVLIGANNCAMELIQIKMVKEVRNNVNRTTNFETANLSKITGCSSEQINAIKKIIKHKKFDTLPNHIKEIAEIRLNNPYASLKELSEMCSEPISKSGINHRLKKLIDLAQKL